MIADIERAVSRVMERVCANGDCLEWQGARRAGYGIISVEGRPEYTHRVIAESLFGEIPHGLYVCHACDNRCCCAPRHLWLGTPAENTRDAVLKGRQHIPRRPRRDYCKRGHPFNYENTILNRSGSRQCRVCVTLSRWRRQDIVRAVGTVTLGVFDASIDVAERTHELARTIGAPDLVESFLTREATPGKVSPASHSAQYAKALGEGARQAARRSISRRRVKGWCAKGHQMTPENTEGRQCTTCKRAWQRKSRGSKAA